MTSVTFSQSPSGIRGAGTHRRFRMNYVVWGIQALLAVLFIFAGGGKLMASSHTLTTEFALPAPFMRFIGVCEALGGVGVFFPGALRIRPALTPLAAAGLVTIMIGATVVTLTQGEIVMATGPAFVGVLAGWVAYRRRPWISGAMSRDEE